MSIYLNDYINSYISQFDTAISLLSREFKPLIKIISEIDINMLVFKDANIYVLGLALFHKVMKYW